MAEGQVRLLAPRAASEEQAKAKARLTRLKWLAIFLPLAFLSLLHYLLHTVLEVFHDWPEILFLLGWVAMGIAIFSFGVFRVIGTLERQILDRNEELSALLAVGRAATSSLKLSEVLDEALDAILGVTSAETGEVWLREEDGELALEQQKGAATEAFRERTRLGPGEGLPGLAAEKGSPVLARDLGSDPRFVRGRVKDLGFQTFYALPLRHRGETVGVLAVAGRHRESLSSESERRLLEGIGERLAVAIENSRLHERVMDRAVLEERERIAHELHDGVAQVLGYINTQTLAIRKHLASGHADEAEAQTEAMEKAARELYTDVREAILGLRTPLSPRDGLIPGLRAYLRGYSEMAQIEAKLEVAEEAETILLPASTEVQLMRIIQEALSNVRKHATASRVTLGLESAADGLRVRVADDGRGFASDRSVHTGWPRFGLQTMRERAEAIGGEFEIVSSPGQGTTVVVRVPVRTQAEALA